MGAVPAELGDTAQGDGTDVVVSMDVVRRIARVSSRIAAGSVLTETLDAVARGIVDVLGFGVAVVNHRRPDGDFEAVAIAGPDEAQLAMLGSVTPRAAMEDILAECVAWGALRYQSHEHAPAEDLSWQWIPQTEPVDDPTLWHPLDMLLAPMLSEGGEMVGVISVDLPPGGRRPSQLLCELLELFAMQAGIAISSVELRDRYRRERAAREDLLVDLAHRDALTGLPNRRALTEALETSVRLARETGRPGAVLFCDLDGLKRLNDREGHARGDEALVAWARELERRVRQGDLVCRIGGDEFVVVADSILDEDADAIAERLREEAPLPAEFGGLTLSVGVALLDGSEEGEELLRLADEAMYVDKARRRGA